MKGMLIHNMHALHEADLAFIDAEIQKAKHDGVSLVIATHHAPSMRGTSPISNAFATNLEPLLRHPVIAWIYGHTHFSYTCAERKLYSNQRGYADEPDEISTFVPNMVIEL